MIWLVRTVVGLWLLSCVLRDAEATMRAARSIWRWLRRPDELAPPPAPPEVLPNFVDGVVLPAAHDPRWKRFCETDHKGEWRFGYQFGEVTVYKFAILVRIGRCDIGALGQHKEALALYEAIAAGRKQADKVRVMDRARAIAAGPALAEEDWQAMERLYPETSRGR